MGALTIRLATLDDAAAVGARRLYAALGGETAPKVMFTFDRSRLVKLAGGNR